MADQIKLTPTERRIMTMLSDGYRHRKSELQTCLGDELATNGTLLVHIANIRKKLRIVGQDIVSFSSRTSEDGESYYMQVRLAPRNT